MSNTESGRANKLQAFATLITFASNGIDYAPPTDDLSVENLKVILTKAEDGHQKVSQANAECQMARSKRNELMTPLNAKARSIKDLAAAINAPQEVYHRLKVLSDSISGNRKLSQLSFDSRIDSFAQIIDVVKGIENYAPTREELQVSGLETYLQEMKTAVKAVIDCEQNLKQAQIEQKTLFGDGTGLYGTTRRVKLYLKSLLGPRNPQYKEVIRITKVIRL